jgi:hypothetical protein
MTSIRFFRTRIRIGRCESVTGFGFVIATGTNAGVLSGVPASSLFTSAPRLCASLIQRLSTFALICLTSATPDTDAPGTWHAATDSDLNIAVCRLRRRFSCSFISVRLFLSGRYAYPSCSDPER